VSALNSTCRAGLRLPYRGTGLALCELVPAWLSSPHRGTAPEKVALRNASSGAPCGVPHSAQRRGHAPGAISAAPRRRGRAGQRLRHSESVLRQTSLCPLQTKGPEGSREHREWPRMHERLAHACGAAELRKKMHERVTHVRGAAKRETKRPAHARDAAVREKDRVAQTWEPA
jgi:hypothetical protein